ncbi:MAG: CbtB domain-containing protein [Deltaproteobacteria bacterium]
MEIGIEREKNVFKALWPAVIVVAMAFALVVIAYGMESIAPGAHDAFHNFRHAIGMPCH